MLAGLLFGVRLGLLVIVATSRRCATGAGVVVAVLVFAGVVYGLQSASEPTANAWSALVRLVSAAMVPAETA